MEDGVEYMTTEDKMRIIRMWGYTVVVTADGNTLMSIRRKNCRFLIAECSSIDECVDECYTKARDEVYQHFSTIWWQEL